MSHQTHYRLYRRWVFTGQWPNQQCQSTEEDRFLRRRLQSHQVHPTVLTIIQRLCSIKQKKTKIQTHKHKWIYAQWNGLSVTKPHWWSGLRLEGMLVPEYIVIFCLSWLSWSCFKHSSECSEITTLTVCNYHTQLHFNIMRLLLLGKVS